MPSFADSAWQSLIAINGSDTYVQVDTNQDMIQLLAIIQGYCCQFNDNQQNTHVLEGAKHQVSTFYHAYDATTIEYVEHFKALVGVVEMYRGTYRNKLELIMV
jgi:hypothetical protein